MEEYVVICPFSTFAEPGEVGEDSFLDKDGYPIEGRATVMTKKEASRALSLYFEESFDNTARIEKVTVN